jgi:hypothetical protein
MNGAKYERVMPDQDSWLLTLFGLGGALCNS